jgi:hypothetical protein
VEDFGAVVRGHVALGTTAPSPHSPPVVRPQAPQKQSANPLAARGRG